MLCGFGCAPAGDCVMTSPVLAPGLDPACPLAPEILGALLEQSFDLVASVDLPEMRLRTLSASGRSLLQVGPGEALAGIAWCDCVTKSTWNAMRTLGLRAIEARRPWHGSGFLRSRNGSEIPVRLAIVVGSAPGASSPCAVITAMDDSRFHHMQTVLRNEQLLLHALFGTLPDSVYFKDRQSRFIRTTASQARKLGAASPEQMIGQTDADYFSADHAEQALADERRIIATGEPIIEVEEKETWPDGRVAWVSTTKLPLRDWQNQIVGTFGISHDITKRKLAEAERRRIEEELFRAQKMESIGRLAAGVAHEINTPTQFITDNAHFLVGAFRQLARVLDAARALRDQAQGHADLATAVEALREAETAAELDYLTAEIPRTLEQSLDGLGRVSRIVQSMREYAHPGSGEKAPVDLNQVVETVVAVSRHEWKHVAEMVTELDPNLPAVPGVRDEINQSILNLVVNAAHAIGDSLIDRTGEIGRITLRTRRHDGWAIIEVADTGTGIPERARAHLFEPFFTTKAAGRGTGQGLALVHTMIAKHHDGLVDFTSELGRGTTFRVQLPITDASRPAVTPPPSPATATSVP
jgi:PAS domain S-box-containing protein